MEVGLYREFEFLSPHSPLWHSPKTHSKKWLRKDARVLPPPPHLRLNPNPPILKGACASERYNAQDCSLLLCLSCSLLFFWYCCWRRRRRWLRCWRCQKTRHTWIHTLTHRRGACVCVCVCVAMTTALKLWKLKTKKEEGSGKGSELRTHNSCCRCCFCCSVYRRSCSCCCCFFS